MLCSMPVPNNIFQKAMLIWGRLCFEILTLGKKNKSCFKYLGTFNLNLKTICKCFDIAYYNLLYKSILLLNNNNNNNNLCLAYLAYALQNPLFSFVHLHLPPVNLLLRCFDQLFS